ncbi:hypothetical protein [Mucilaginibacter agri]|uniref:Lipoprotein n=1 Tax=Mucilaginibacter agri TaxID=2695265 RepID=A0A966DT66_9SPHI|nr:hypothetical protein [Mucilaginibacter agri]NCD70330.1 hypothetical protein [Mucilaginibacter agri]
MNLKSTFKTLTILCLLATLITACKKDTSAPDDETTSTSNSYQPLTLNSNWKYAVDFPTKDTTVMTITSGTKTFNGKVYQSIQSKGKSGTSTGYYFNKDHFFNMRNSAAGTGDVIDFTYLNDTAKVNYTWTAKITDDGTLDGIPARMTGKIVEKGISKTISGKTYSKVIHTTVNLQYALSGSSYDTYATYDFYVAQGIGIIEIDSSTYGITSTVKLIGYDIK